MPRRDRVRARPQIAVLGIETFGEALVKRLLAAGVRVHVWSRSGGSAMYLAGLGATIYEDPRSAVSGADVVLTLLSSADAVRSVMLECSTIDALRAGAVWAQMTSIELAAIEELAIDVACRGPDIGFVDAPVVGGREAVEAGELLVLAAGPGTAIQRLEDVVADISCRTLRVGVVGSATRLKLVMTMWSSFVLEGTVEAAALADRLGVHASTLAEALAFGPPATSQALACLSKIERGDDIPDLTLSSAHRNISAAVKAGGLHTVPVAGAIARRWSELVSLGWGPLDVSAVRQSLGCRVALDEWADIAAQPSAQPFSLTTEEL